MPHTHTPPESPSQILATASHDPTWSAMLSKHPIPTGEDWGDDVTFLKDLSEGMFPRLRATLDASRPTDVMERDAYIDIPSTELKGESGRIRVVICQAIGVGNGAMDGNVNRDEDGKGEAKANPVILLFHGGGHTIGNPEGEVPLARRLVQRYNAVVIMPAYRLAPDHPFPSSFNDCFEVLEIVAGDIAILQASTTSADAPRTQVRTQLLPSTITVNATRDTPFILGGTSAGATIAFSIAHLYHRFRSTSPYTLSPSASSSSSPSHLPPLTGLSLSCGTYIIPDRSTLPRLYHKYYLSQTQNSHELPLDAGTLRLFHEVSKPDLSSSIWPPFNQCPEISLPRESVADDHKWMAGTPSSSSRLTSHNSESILRAQPPLRIHMQACGADLTRDDTLILERVLRTECGVSTRLDLYEGFGHVFWGVGGGYASLEMARVRIEDAVEGVGWVVGG